MTSELRDGHEREQLENEWARLEAWANKESLRLEMECAHATHALWEQVRTARNRLIAWDKEQQKRET